ncbi:hypothetical protein [Anaerofustis sp. NSJ-163]|uniref:hypothetical protein n=1 Tax=Anaerofustis sp. NSJ-163 TaxID=2944391 RepID=UPI00209C5AC1|nr:hypothetical protein [Anaerofustis sp. NSJ-163]MCO8193306.1 hypothetical protein [Anaerofustis sp. NSJ-163]
MKKIISLFFVLVFIIILCYSFNIDSSSANVIDYKEVLYSIEDIHIIDIKTNDKVKTISGKKDIIEFIDKLDIDDWKVYENDAMYKGKENEKNNFSYNYVLTNKKYKINILVSDSDNIVKFKSVDCVMCFEVPNDVVEYLNDIN